MQPAHNEASAVDILVVEDSPTQAEQLCYLLQQHGYRTRMAANGRLGLEEIRRCKPTLVISDIVMPEMDGYALCRAVKADPELKDIPVVIVTSLSGIQDIARSLECGADNFIRKPYEPHALLARVEYILLNLELRKGKRINIGLEVYLGGKKHYITSEREQIIDLLISTYEEAVRMNEEMQQQQIEIARSSQTLAGLYRIADELNRVSTPAQVCELALQATMDLPKFEAGWIYLADADGKQSYRLVAASKTGPAASQQGSDTLEWIGDISSATATGRNASVPLALERRHLGVIQLLAVDGESFNDEDLNVLDTIGNQVAVALERAHLHQHLENLVEQRTAALQAEVVERRRAEERVVSLNRIYAVLSNINTLIVRVHEREELFREACRVAVEFGHFGLAWVGMTSADNAHIKPTAWHGVGLWAESIGFAAATDVGNLDEALVDEAIQQQQTVVCRDLAQAAGMPLAALAVSHGYHALCALPLQVDKQTVALMFLYAHTPEVFNADEMHLLEELAGNISFALDHIAKEERINYLAYYDALTGLPNRDLLLERLRQSIGFAQRHGSTVAVICLDLDRFKIVNDGLGHYVGDKLLQTVAGLLSGMLRDGDTVGRLVADKFVMICADLHDADDLPPVIERLQAVLRAPIPVGDESTNLTASVGISLCPKDSDDPITLVKYAELAMYQAKERGGNQHRLFTTELDTRVSERVKLQNRLGAALEAGELVVYYQPQVSAMNGVVCGMEALIRWRHPQFGLVPPGQFIPVAEESGLIIPIGEWVLQEACRQNKAWHDEGLSDFPVSVNLSIAQLRDSSLLASVRRALDETGLGPRYLELELTESMMMENPEMLIAFLQRTRDMGIQISIDDFGTGYSSLNYLKRLPLDRLKVDYSFVRDITRDPASASICRAVIAIAHNLRLGVVAEGVETEGQASYLARHYCESLQGYYFSKPVPADEITALLRKREPLIKLAAELNARRTLLLVDDEENIRNALRRLLRSDGYQILLASGPTEAFELLATNRVGVILADQRMPDMSGTEFLRRVKDIYPDAIRIVLSGYTDLDTVTASINQGSVYKFLAKPWDNDALREVLREAFWRYELSKGIATDWYSAGGVQGLHGGQ
ncbi:MAG: EAL domain-containing protein [Proteobacteria bacterium]|nr:EAL domain-containing protein [Pseudomonadota bacterium]